MRKDILEKTVSELVAKPGHEKVRGLLLKLLTDGLGADSTSIDFEKPLPEVRGRIDALLGRTVFEIKRDLARERADAEGQLLRYLVQREKETGELFTGIATDGADFRVYAVRDGALQEIGAFKPKVDAPRALLVWLESVVVLSDSLPPDVEIIRQELGRESVHYRRALKEIEALWQRLKDHPEVVLKRDLWNRLLRTAYGADIEVPGLFLQHTYLTIVAKTLVTVALNDSLPTSGAALLDGKQFRDLGIVGAVEADFFDWILLDQKGAELVMEIGRHVNRFRLHEIEADILKGLYESLIDPEQRHDLGEYYTPDWLAERICITAIKDPLSERVIDPACGSGTFLFHAIRRLLAAARKERLTSADAVARACEKIAGVDVHPVAVIFARATYLLALAPTFAQGRPATITIPVYLGDSLQWNTREFMHVRDLEVVVPAQGTGAGTLPEEDEAKRAILRFPESVATDPSLFDATLDIMLDLAGKDRPASDFEGWLIQRGVDKGAGMSMLLETYGALRKLQKEGRNHIWGYVARNLSRPIWLASESQKADVVLGNPPWLRYSMMSKANKQKFKEEATRAGLWVGGKSATANDLSAYFFARSVQLYMRKSGRIAFVLPYATLSREPYQEFRKGKFAPWREDRMQVRFTDAWVFPSEVQPLFPVPSCVLFAERYEGLPKLPEQVLAFEGSLPRRDATRKEADSSLREARQPWPRDDQGARGSLYREKFRQGATLVPRRLVIVERLPAGKLGANPAAPRVKGRTSSQDKKPWKDLEPPEGPIEAQFLRPVYLGENIAPYRLLEPVLGIIPWNEKAAETMDAAKARARGFSRLAAWLEHAEALWKAHGTGSMSLEERWDYNGAVAAQFPIATFRVFYAASGTNPAAVLVADGHRSIAEHKLYWMAARERDDGRYLTAILNCETARARAERWQSEGQWGKRDFDKAVFNLPIPLFDAKLVLHRDLAAAAAHAETIAAAVPLKEGEHFTRARKRIRNALRADGIADEIDQLVATLLG